MDNTSLAAQPLTRKGGSGYFTLTQLYHLQKNDCTSHIVSFKFRPHISADTYVGWHSQYSCGICFAVGLHFIEKRAEAVEGFVDGRDVFVVLAMRFGKSLCYSLLPLVFDRLHGRSSQDRRGSIVFVVSPLLALMKDKVASLKKQGLRAAYISGETDESFFKMKHGDKLGAFQIVFFTPEALLTGIKWRHLLTTDEYQARTVALVIDEAHCVLKWLEQVKIDQCVFISL